MHAHDAHPRLHGSQRERDSGSQAAPADRDHDGLDVRHLVDDLEPDRPLARDHLLVLVGMDEGGAGRLDVRQRGGQRLLEARAAELRLGAVVLRRLDLRHRGVLRHEDRRLDPGIARRPRDCLAVVARARRNDARALLALREGRDLADRPANLERARALEVLGLQADVAAGQLRECLRAVDRGDARDPVEPPARLLDLAQRRCRVNRQA